MMKIASDHKTHIHFSLIINATTIITAVIVNIIFEDSVWFLPIQIFMAARTTTLVPSDQAAMDPRGLSSTGWTEHR